MNQNKTESILQRVPKILAVTAASYGLSENSRERVQQADTRKGAHPQGARRRETRH